MLSFTNFVENASACALSFKSSQSTIQRLIIFYTQFLPYFIPPYANGRSFQMTSTVSVLGSAYPLTDMRNL